MDTRDDMAISKIEGIIEQNRAAQPCDDYVRTSRVLPHCSNCGWIHEDDPLVRLTVYMRGNRTLTGQYPRLGAALRLRFTRHLEGFMGHKTEALK